MVKGSAQWQKVENNGYIYVYMIKNRKKKLKVKLRDIIKNSKNIQIGKQKKQAKKQNYKKQK